jgi:NADH-quinone oxidoreductase subunit M
MALAGLGAVLTAVYFVKVLRMVAQGGPGEARAPTAPTWPLPSMEATTQELGVWAPLVVLTVLIGLAPGVLLELVDPAVRLLLGGAA